MAFKISSGDYEVIESGVVLAADENEDIKFQHEADEKFGFSFEIDLEFEVDEKKTREISTKIDGDKLVWKCINFKESGTGITSPIKLATSNGKDLYFAFWSYLLGNGAGKARTRKVEYTFYVKEQVS